MSTPSVSDILDDDAPLWLINEKIKGLLEGDGADEDHQDVLNFLRQTTGLPEGTIHRMHRAIVHGDNKVLPEQSYTPGVTAIANERRRQIDALKGQKPTRWSPSPEDLAAIRNAQNRHAIVAEMPGGGIAFLNYGDANSEDYAHLDCPACGGSGHVGDTRAGAFRDVLAERRRQIEVEGWTPEHDDRHAEGLAAAAACYAVGDRNLMIEGDVADIEVWPWNESWWKPTNRRRDLVKAAALILAEIERLDRMVAARIRRARDVRQD